MNLLVARESLPCRSPRRLPRFTVSALCFVTFAAAAATARAQDAPAGAAPDPSEAPPMPPSPPVTAEPTAPNPPQPPPIPKAERPPGDDPLGPQYKKLNSNVWLHTGGYLHNPANPKKLNDVYGDGEVDLLFSGQVHRNLLWQADFVATWPGPTAAGTSPEQSSRVEILDLIAKIEGSDNLINLWFGRMLVPSDRANFSGFWFAAPWSYPGNFAGAFGGPRQGPFGRNDGATLWGQLLEGRLKWYGGAYNLHDAGVSPLISTRVNIALLSPEPGYYHSSTYYGEDHLSLGLSYQYQKKGSGSGAMTDDYNGFSTDLLFEKNLGAAGTVDLEGSYYKYSGDFEPINWQFFALASYMTADRIGWGKLQPLVRWQQAHPKGGGDDFSVIDAQVAYVIDGYAARITGGYSHAKNPGPESNTIFLGIQLQR